MAKGLVLPQLQPARWKNLPRQQLQEQRMLHLQPVWWAEQEEQEEQFARNLLLAPVQRIEGRVQKPVPQGLLPL